MRPSIVFLDVDGTVMDDWGVIHPSTRTACAQARERGHLLYLCTGRTTVELDHIVSGIATDGYIGAAGAVINVEGEIVRVRAFRPDILADIVGYLADHGARFYLQTDTSLIAGPGFMDALTELVDAELARHPTPGLKDRLADYLTLFDQGPTARDDVLKLGFLAGHSMDMDDAAARFAGRADLVGPTVPLFGPGSGEFLQHGLHKASAIAWLLDRLGLDRADTVGIGDSSNDMEMLEYCAVGVAMGNATDEAKAAADFVTTDIKDDGLAWALADLGLADPPEIA